MFTVTALLSAASRRRSFSTRSECLKGNLATAVAPPAPGTSLSRLRLISGSGAVSGPGGPRQNTAPSVPALQDLTSSGRTTSALLDIWRQRLAVRRVALSQHQGAPQHSQLRLHGASLPGLPDHPACNSGGAWQAAPWRSSQEIPPMLPQALGYWKADLCASLFQASSLLQLPSLAQAHRTRYHIVDSSRTGSDWLELLQKPRGVLQQKLSLAWNCLQKTLAEHQ